MGGTSASSGSAAMSEVKDNGGQGEGIIMMSGLGAQTLGKADDEVVIGSGV